MSNPEDTVNQFLKSMGFSVQLTPLEGFPSVKFAVISHMGLNMVIFLDGPFIYPVVNLGYIPKANVAPLFRRMLTLNGQMGGPCFFVRDDNSIALQVARQVEGIDLVEFRLMMDSLGTNYWQHAQHLIQEFQIPAQPS